MRREIWERAGEAGSSGRRLHRTTSAQPEAGSELANLTAAELNKKFINTFLYKVTVFHIFSVTQTFIFSS